MSGIDGSPSAVAHARERLQGEDLRADLRVGDYLNLPWKDAVFDAVVDIASLYANRAENFKQALHEVRRVLKPGGLIFSISFSKNSWGYGLGRNWSPMASRTSPKVQWRDVVSLCIWTGNGCKSSFRDSTT